MPSVWAVLCALAAFCLVLPCAVEAAPFGKKDLKRMSVFISNFTELGFYDLDVTNESGEALYDLDVKNGSDWVLSLGGPDSAPDLIHFGIWHNYLNNESRIKKCAKKNCEHGSLTIEGKFVQESVKKYFDLNLKNRSEMESDYPPYYFDGKLYHFEGADGQGEVLYYPEVKTASQEGGVVRMSGEIYSMEDLKIEKSSLGTFQAVAKPYKWNGKDTWAILSLRREYQ